MRVAQSSHIQGYDYDQGSSTLTIQFTNGAVYNYGGVDANTYYAFAQSSSPGGYFHSKIKGQFAATKVAQGDTRKRKQ
jgi:hypothetical protein